MKHNYGWVLGLLAAIICTYAAINPPSGLVSRSLESYALESPTDLVVDFVATNKVKLIWSSHSASQESGFRIEAALPNSAWKELASTGRNITNCIVTSSLATSYLYRVRGHVYSAYTPSANSLSDGKPILISWQNNSDSPTEFSVERQVGTNSWKQVAVVTQTIGGYLDSAVSSNTLYSYRVRSHGYSNYSNVDFLLPAPTNLHVTSVCFNQISLAWDYPTNLLEQVNFVVSRSTNNVDWEDIAVITNNPAALPP